ncbi:hypothetical protein P168DRAFT_119302 [Aspergillus campestris IBT 28561]|uniref:Uncharacterized protein n=1 Tax=Aspergillus campestris (strain IBT 28561) TaxID=1392248 RepID=A0A2I1DAA9_ASPC2|nr:uncharacterized protein P168DRAFT_119302 [Aspergillus campestris IBT 28561]PKY06815.1 hypothetical protein P168DRAFT_119302 [Aspergillus campestris IBT 28561]
MEDRRKGEGRQERKRKIEGTGKKENGREPGNPTWYQDGKIKREPGRDEVQEKDQLGREEEKPDGRKKEKREKKNKCLNEKRTFHKHFSGRKKKEKKKMKDSVEKDREKRKEEGRGKGDEGCI